MSSAKKIRDGLIRLHSRVYCDRSRCYSGQDWSSIAKINKTS
jgi:hypothetical protein